MNEQLKQLLLKETGDLIEQGRLEVRSSNVESPEKVREAIKEFSFDSGWLCLTDRVIPLYSAEDLLQAQSGIILSAELAGRSESLHIRQAEEGWTITRYKAGAGEECLIFREEYVSTENKQRDRLQYDVCWKLDNGSYRPWAARLSAMVKGGAQ